MNGELLRSFFQRRREHVLSVKTAEHVLSTLPEAGAAKLPRTYGSSPRNGSE